MRVGFTIVETFEVAPERLFDFTNATENFISFTGYGPIPGIREARYETAGAPALGSRRRILKTEGTVHLEEIIAFDRPARHNSRITGISPPFSWLVADGEDDWRFSPHGSGTLVQRTFSFALRSPIAAIVAVPLMQIFMKAAVRRDLANIKRRIA